MSPGKISCFWVLLLIFTRGIRTVSMKETYLKKTQKDHAQFCPEFRSENETQFVKWYFHSKKNRYLLIKWQRESPPWIIPQEEYQGRLSLLDGKCLEIKNLTLQDSGSYEFYIMSTSGKSHIENFNLTVFDAVTAENNTSEYLHPEFLFIILFSVLAMMNL